MDRSHMYRPESFQEQQYVHRCLLHSVYLRKAEPDQDPYLLSSLLLNQRTDLEGIQAVR